jgi:hypothetical protein
MSPVRHPHRRRDSYLIMTINPLVLAYLVIGIIATTVFVWAMRHR